MQSSKTARRVLVTDIGGTHISHALLADGDSRVVFHVLCRTALWQPHTRSFRAGLPCHHFDPRAKLSTPATCVWVYWLAIQSLGQR